MRRAKPLPPLENVDASELPPASTEPPDGARTEPSSSDRDTAAAGRTAAGARERRLAHAPNGA